MPWAMNMVSMWLLSARSGDRQSCISLAASAMIMAMAMVVVVVIATVLIIVFDF
jgi:uncharacterized membrane protein YidH (DUF202 family)